MSEFFYEKYIVIMNIVKVFDKFLESQFHKLDKCCIIKSVIEEGLSRRQGNDLQTFAFAITADGRVVGSIGVFRQGNIHRQTTELGYYVAEEYWGKGIMAEAVKNGKVIDMKMYSLLKEGF